MAGGGKGGDDEAIVRAAAAEADAQRARAELAQERARAEAAVVAEAAAKVRQHNCRRDSLWYLCVISDVCVWRCGVLYGGGGSRGKGVVHTYRSWLHSVGQSAWSTCFLCVCCGQGGCLAEALCVGCRGGFQATVQPVATSMRYVCAGVLVFLPHQAPAQRGPSM